MRNVVMKRYLGAPPTWVRASVLYCLALLVLLILEHLTFVAAAMPLTIATSNTLLTVSIDGSELSIPMPSSPTQIYFLSGDPAVREFQLDGTDSINNFSLDSAYMHRIANTPYYRFQAWMRNFDSYSSWRDIAVRASATGQLVTSIPEANTSTLVSLPSGSATVTASVVRLVFVTIAETGALPFAEPLRPETIEAIEAARRSDTVKFDSIEEMFADLHEDD